MPINRAHEPSKRHQRHDDLLQRQEVKEATATEMPTTQAGAAKPRCNSTYNHNDSNGHFSMQQKCGGNSIQWGFKINKNRQQHITGKVKEAGLNWSRNGKNQSRNSPHKVAKNYHFHGSLGAKKRRRDQL